MILIEELGQLYQFIAPVSLWFSYLISYQEADGFFGVTMSILLALFYLILKVKSLKRNTNLFNSCRLVFFVCFYYEFILLSSAFGIIQPVDVFT